VLAPSQLVAVAKDKTSLLTM